MSRVDRFIAALHERRHGHRPVWVNDFDGIGLDWYCAKCRPERVR